jgi:hypothetical protein
MQLRRAFWVVFTILAIASVPAAAAAQSTAEQPLKIDIKDLGLSFLPPASDAATSMAPRQTQHEGIGIGALVGPYFDRLSHEDDEIDFSNKTGWQFSLFIGGNRPGRVGVATEITLLRRKSEGEGSEIKFNTLQVPVFVRVNVGSQNLDRASVYVKFGPAIDVVLKAEQDGIDIIDDVERFQVDLIGAVGVEITRFIVEGRYIHGLRALNKEFEDEGKIKYKAFAILFGVRFN